MNFISYFVILFVYLIIGLIYSPMITFAIQENVDNHNLCLIDLKKTNVCIDLCCKKIKGNNLLYQLDNNNVCINSCCIKPKMTNGFFIGNNNIKKKLVKIIVNINTFSIYDSNLYLIDKKVIIKARYGPYYERKISNYSYHTLIEIIKSNT